MTTIPVVSESGAGLRHSTIERVLEGQGFTFRMRIEWPYGMKMIMRASELLDEASRNPAARADAGRIRMEVGYGRTLGGGNVEVVVTATAIGASDSALEERMKEVITNIGRGLDGMAEGGILRLAGGEQLPTRIRKGEREND